MIDAPWLAGFFEGEGSIYIKPATRRAGCELCVCVVNTERDLLEPFTEVGGTIRTRSSPRPGHRQAYRWRLAGHRALEFLDLIAPHMRASRNRARVELARQLQALKGPRGRHLTDEQRQAEQRIYELMQEWNSHARA